MKDDLVFYTNPMSRGRVARWMLEETGRPYRTEILEYGTTMKAPAYLAINPMGKVPAIRHGEMVVTESAAICAYLADAFPESGLAPPPGDPRRGPYYRWMFFAAGPMDGAITGKALGVEVPADKKAMVGYGCMEDVLNTLETALNGGDYLTGDRFTAADLFVASLLGWTMGFGIVEKRPIFERYVERCTARPAAVRAREIDDALLPADRRPSAGT